MRISRFEIHLHERAGNFLFQLTSIHNTRLPMTTARKIFAFHIFLLLGTFLVKAAPERDSLFTENAITLHTNTGDIYGTLTLPNAGGKTVALFLSGSGPTDRNGNSMLTKNDALRQLAFQLAGHGIASLRFDKRGIGESKAAIKSEADLRFDDYVNDAVAWIKMLKTDNRFNKIIVIGHSEGSLIGMLASHGLTDGFISIAGAGKPAGQLIKDQLATQPQQIKDLSYPVIDSLIAGKTVPDVTPLLFQLFRPSVQPYMISWFRYDPAVEISKLKMPVLIIQGTKDLQVGEEDARLLAKGNPQATLVLIKDMNHVLKTITGDKTENAAAYNNPSLPLNDDLTTAIIKFIREEVNH
jgi:alpha-beta hydrolase superfamily lysophospholipase